MVGQIAIVQSSYGQWWIKINHCQLLSSQRFNFLCGEIENAQETWTQDACQLKLLLLSFMQTGNIVSFLLLEVPPYFHNDFNINIAALKYVTSLFHNDKTLCNPATCYRRLQEISSYNSLSPLSPHHKPQGQASTKN